MKISIRELLENPEKVISNDESNLFYDWFCRDKALYARAMNLIPKLRFLVNEGIIDGSKNYVWFKNNCPLDGSLYDDIRISNIEAGDFLGGFCPRTGHKKEDKCNIWILVPNYKTFDFKNWNAFKKEVKNNSKLKEELQKVFG